VLAITGPLIWINKLRAAAAGRRAAEARERQRNSAGETVLNVLR
jgi:hypothetical protein